MTIVSNVFYMVFAMDDTLSILRPFQVPLFEIVMQKSFSHAGICSRLRCSIDAKMKNDQKTVEFDGFGSGHPMKIFRKTVEIEVFWKGSPYENCPKNSRNRGFLEGVTL